MKLGTKIFCCVMIFFSTAFLLAGYVLLSGFFDMVMRREMTIATEQHQYNKFVIQSAIISKGEEWFRGLADGKYDIGSIAEDMGNLVAIYKMDGTKLYSKFPANLDVSDFLPEIDRNTVICKSFEAERYNYILIAGIIAKGETSVYLVTGVDISGVLRQQEEMISKFRTVYAGAIIISLFLVFILSAVLTGQIKKLAEAAKSIAGGDYAKRIGITSEDEVGQLAENFNQMAEAVEEKIQELSEYARQKEDFVANFAHELKTPLTSIIGYSNRIYQKELPREEQKKAAWYIWNEGMRLEGLSYRLMDLTNLNRGEFVLQVIRADELLRELVDDIAYFTEEKQTTIKLEADRAMIRVEYDLFKTLFLNLIDNAVKAGADCIRVYGKILEGRLPHYEIGIEDNGSGIPAKELKKITEAFYMIDKSRSRKQHGAGIGLALAEKIANIHGSRLRFDSKEGQGTVVSVILCCEGGASDE